MPACGCRLRNTKPRSLASRTPRAILTTQLRRPERRWRWCEVHSVRASRQLQAGGYLPCNLLDRLASGAHGYLSGAVMRKPLSVERAEGVRIGSQRPQVFLRRLGRNPAALEQLLHRSLDEDD